MRSIIQSMKCLCFLLPLLAAPGMLSQSAAADAAKPVTRTFYVTGIECGSCVYMVQQSIATTKGVAEVEVMQSFESTATVTFDPQVVSEHQVAQAVREAYPLHGTPYLATLKLKVADAARSAAKMSALVDRWREWVRFEPVDKSKGEWLVHFKELKNDPEKTGRRGWSVTEFAHAMNAAAISFEIEEEK